MKSISVRNSEALVMVDDSDFDVLSAWKWYLGSHGYAYRHDDNRHSVLMHRWILGLKTGDERECDHKDRNKLNNQRGNLRIVSHSENMKNRWRKGHSGRITKGIPLSPSTIETIQKLALKERKLWAAVARELLEKAASEVEIV